MIPVGNETACRAKIEDCLSQPENYLLSVDDTFICPRCDNGKTWDYENEKCDDCEDVIDHCELCNFHSTCRRCEEGWFLSMDTTHCITFENCEDEDQTDLKKMVVRSEHKEDDGDRRR